MDVNNKEKLIRMKGKSLIDFPENYVCIDTETTGLDPKWDEIIEIGAIRFRNGIETDRFSQLIKPNGRYYLSDDDDSQDYVIEDGEKVQYIDEFISSLTGITNKDLEHAPSIKDVLPEFLDFTGDDVIVGHNINFDINFIYDEVKKLYGKDFQNDFVDTMRIGRRVLKELSHHRLQDLAEHYNIDYTRAHRAVEDADITSQVFTELKKDVIKKYGSFEALKETVKRSHQGLYVQTIIGNPEKADEDNVLYGKTVCITGVLEKMLRKQALQLVADIGGIPMDSVTKKTNFLVLGNNDYCKAIKDGKSGKQKKAEKLILDGEDIQIISENVFYELIGCE